MRGDATHSFCVALNLRHSAAYRHIVTILLAAYLQDDGHVGCVTGEYLHAAFYYGRGEGVSMRAARLAALSTSPT